MPEKDGDESKSTKSVVNKKQKQMMGEEGYDIARDMGRVRPSKDKKDATTMPPSKEMEKTRKVYKGPSALELIKKKYKGQIMDLKKEELDLTKVAESFGGYIVEAEVTKGQGDERKKKLTGTGKVTFGRGRTPQEKTGVERLAKAAGIDTDKYKKLLKPQNKQQSAAAQAFRDMSASGEKVTDDVKQGLRNVAQGGDEEPKPYTPRGSRAQRVRGASGEKPTGSSARGTYKSSPAGQRAYAAAKADMEARKGFSRSKSGGLKDDERNPYVKRDVRQSRVDDLGGNIYDQPKFTQKDFEKSLKDVKKSGEKFIGPRQTQSQVDKRLGKVKDPSSPTDPNKTFKQFRQDSDQFNAKKLAIRNLRASQERMGKVSPVQKRKKDKQLEKELSQRRTAQDKQQQRFNRQYDAYDDGDLGNPEFAKSSQLSRQKVTDFKTGKETEKMAPEKGGSVVVYRQRKGEDLVRDLRKKKDPIIKPEIVQGGEGITGGLRTVNATRLQNIKATSKIALQRYGNFARNNPALGLATYDIGKGIIGKIMKARIPPVRGGRAGTRTAGSFTAS